MFGSETMIRPGSIRDPFGKIDPGKPGPESGKLPRARGATPSATSTESCCPPGRPGFTEGVPVRAGRHARLFPDQRSGYAQAIPMSAVETNLPKLRSASDVTDVPDAR
jgi:hypothetical protein